MLQSDTTRLSFAQQGELMLPFVQCVVSFLMQETSKDTRMNNLKQRINDDMKLQSGSAGERGHCASGFIGSLLCNLTQERTPLQPGSLHSLQALHCKHIIPKIIDIERKTQHDISHK